MSKDTIKKEISIEALKRLIEHVQESKKLLDEVKKHANETQLERDKNNTRSEQYDTLIDGYKKQIEKLTNIEHLKGDTGEKGKDGKDGQAGRNGIDGRHGRDGIDGKDGQAGRNGIDGIGINGKDGRDGKDGKNAEFDEEQLIKNIIKSIQKDKLIDVSHINNLQGWIKDGVKYRFEELMHGAGSGGSSSGTPVYNEIVAGSGTTFTLAHTPKVGTVVIYGEGQRLTPGAGNDYTISGAILTLTNSFNIGTILADYLY